jgi:hypothetical protein
MQFKKEWSLADIIQLLTLVVLVATAYFAVRELDLTRKAHETIVELERQKKALEIINRWNDPQVANLRHRAIHGTQQEDGKTSTPDEEAIQSYLNFLEEMALAIYNRAASEEICRQYFNRILLNTYGKFRELIESGPGYPHLKWLYGNWSKMDAPVKPLPLEREARPR